MRTNVFWEDGQTNHCFYFCESYDIYYYEKICTDSKPSQHGPGPAEFGVLGTPSIILFHGRKEVARYNESISSIEHLTQWTKSVTRLKGQPAGNR